MIKFYIPKTKAKKSVAKAAGLDGLSRQDEEEEAATRWETA